MATKRIDGLDIPNKIIQTDVDGNLVASDLATGTFTPTLATFGSQTNFTFNLGQSNVTINQYGKTVVVDYTIVGTVNPSNQQVTFAISLTSGSILRPNISMSRAPSALIFSTPTADNALCSMYWSANKLILDFVTNPFTANTTGTFHGQITYIAQ